MHPLAAAVAYAALLAPAPSPETFPADPEKAVEKFDKDARAIDKKAREAIRQRQAKLVEHLKKVQADHVKKGQKKEAAAIGDYLLLLEATATPAPAAAAPPVSFKALKAASVGGKYKRLLKVLHVPGDKASYKDFSDFGMSATPTYYSYTDLPTGYWVYVHPYWFIWGDQP